MTLQRQHFTSASLDRTRRSAVGSTRRTAGWVLGWIMILGALLLAGAGGCGEKIAIPEASGLFGVTNYYIDDYFAETDPVQILVAKGFLFVLSGDGRLSRRFTDYSPDVEIDGLSQPTALCADEDGDMIFVWEQGLQRVSAFGTNDLETVGNWILPEVKQVAGMATCPAGVDGIEGGRTFLYLADQDSSVVHRYLFDNYNDLSPYGILARRYRAGTQEEGAGLRFVHVPGGMARDHEDSLLVCELDSVRNWVIRFSAVPDYSDVTADPDDQDPWRGLSVRFGEPSCGEEVASDFTLGKAEECDEPWIEGPSSEPGQFTVPWAVTLDGSGRIFVADTGNDRIQIFDADGEYIKLFGNVDWTPRPTSLAVVDKPKGSTYFGGYVFVVVPDSQQVRKFISAEQREHERHIEPDN
ncbi:MAG: hypothetical protein ABIF77_02335 [bacterium]